MIGSCADSVGEPAEESGERVGTEVVAVGEFGVFDVLSDLAHECYVEGNSERAVVVCRRWRRLTEAAGDELTTRYLWYIEAIGHLELGALPAAQSCLERLLDLLDPDETVWPAKTLAILAEVHYRLGRPGHAVASIAEADWRAGQVTGVSYGHTSARMAVALALRTVDLYEQADQRLAEIEMGPDPTLRMLVAGERAVTSASWAMALLAIGDREGAGEQLSRTASRALLVEEQARAAGNPTSIARARVLGAWASAGLGELGLARMRAEEAAGGFEHRPEVFESFLLRLLRAEGARADGDLDRARALLSEGLDQAESTGRTAWTIAASQELAAVESDAHGHHRAVDLWQGMATGALRRAWIEREGRFMALQDRHAVRRLVEETDRMGVAVLEDPLTGLGNRRMLVESLDAPHDLQVTALFVDLDQFKEVNDAFSHEVGDEALRRVARIIDARCRGTDVVTRYGGDEFVVLSTLTGEAAVALAERLRVAVAEEDWEAVAPGLRITVSVGIGHAAAPRRALASADRALAEAKRGGRDRVAVAAGLEG
ncbi:diguanylate cyclase [Actinotalea sp.]|uniref:GGDEF domain-containing protein n=1 Tax=Actinotalea sp. TaxID=1872145 RepID=UPI003565DB73